MFNLFLGGKSYGASTFFKFNISLILFLFLEINIYIFPIQYFKDSFLQINIFFMKSGILKGS